MEMLEGIVLSQDIYKENSKLIKVINKDEIHTFLVRSSCKYSSKNFAYSQDLTKINYDFHKSTHQSFDIITNGQVLNAYVNIKNDYQRLQTSALILSLVCKHGEFVSDYNNLYRLLDDTLQYLNNCDNKYIRLYECIFRLKFLYLIGYGPKFSSCVLCGKKSEFFSIKDGGCVCNECVKSFHVSTSLTALLKYLYLIRLDDLKTLDFDNIDFDITLYLNDIKDIIDKYYLYHVN